MHQGFGVAQLSTWLVADLLAQGELMRVLPSQAVDGLPLYLLWQRSRQLLPKVDAVLAMGVWGIATRRCTFSARSG